MLLILPLPIVLGQAPVPGPGEERRAQPPPPPQGIAMLGFKKGEYPIPIDGNTIPVHTVETVWLLAKEDVDVAFGVKGQQARATQVKQGGEFKLAFPSLNCCGNTQQFELSVAGRNKSEKATLILIGEEQLKEIDAQVVVSQTGIEIIPRGSAKSPINQIALMKPGGEEVSADAEYGSIKYKNVIKPQSTLKIVYTPSSLIDRATSTATFILESPRVYKNEGPKISIFKNGTISSLVVKLNQGGNNPTVANLDVPDLGALGKGGDTPLRPGLSFLHFYITDESGSITANIYLPLLILDNDNFSILDYTNSKNSVSFPLAGRPPVRLVLYAATSMNGVTTAFASKEVMLPVSRITVTDGRKPVTDYSVSVEPDVPKTNVGGTTYLLSNGPDLVVTLTRLKVNNFTVSDFRINGSGSNQMRFPQDMHLIAKVQQLKIETTDEFGEDVRGGTIRIRKNDEEYMRGLGRTLTLSLPSGTYTLDVLVAGRLASGQTVAINSTPGTVTIVVNRLSVLDRGITAVILVELIAVIVLSTLFVRRLRGRIRRRAGEESEIDKSGIPLKHVD